MVGFVSKFKSLAQQAQQKVSEATESEQFKSAIKQAQEKVSEFSATAQAKWKEAQGNHEQQQIMRAVTFFEKKDFPKAINILRKMPAKSEHYEEAQQKLTEYVNAYLEFVRQVAATAASSVLFNTAITLLKAIPESATGYGQAQAGAVELDEVWNKIIRRHRNLIPMIFNKKTVAAAFVDETAHLVTSLQRRRFIYNSAIKSSTYADGEYVIVQLLVRNDSKKTRTISASSMTLVDVQGREFQVSSTGQNAYIFAGHATAEAFSTQLQPTLAKTITIIFDIPQDVGMSLLKIPSFRGSTDLPLSLAI